jgi:hypothetical protein
MKNGLIAASALCAAASFGAGTQAFGQGSVSALASALVTADNGPPSAPAEIARWGIHAELVGKTFVFRDRFHKFAWVVPGRVMKFEHGMFGSNSEEYILTWVDGVGAVTKNGKYALRITPEGLLHWNGAWGFRIIKVGNDYARVTVDPLHAGKTGALAPLPALKPANLQRATVLTRVTTQAQFDAVQTRNIAEVQAMLAKADAERRAARAANGGGGGLLRALNGAIAGAQGMVDGGGGMDAAMAGASIGVLGAAMGADPSSIRDSVSQGATEVAQSNADAQRQFASSMAAAGAPGYGRTTPSSASSSTGSPLPSTQNQVKTTRKLLYCIAHGPGGKVTYASRVGSFEQGENEASPVDQAKSGFRAFLSNYDLAGVDCHSETSQAGVDAFANFAKSKAGQWIETGYTPSIPGR